MHAGETLLDLGASVRLAGEAKKIVARLGLGIFF